MKHPRPCVFLWFAREHSPDEQYADSSRITSALSLPRGRSNVVVGDEPDEVSIGEMIEQLPLSYKFVEQVIEAATRAKLEFPKFIIAAFYRDAREAPDGVPHKGLFHFLGRFEFEFPEPGDFVSRDDHEWLGVSEEYVLGVEPKGVLEEPKGLWKKLARLIMGRPDA